MKKIFFVFSMILFLVMCGSTSYADTYTFQPNPVDMQDLDHSYYYLWKINWSIPSGHHITGASLFIDDINNWAIESDILYINLLNNSFLFSSWELIGSNSTSNLYRKKDNEGGGNNFSSQGILLTTYSDTNQIGQNNPPEDWTYNFTLDQIATLTNYASVGVFGFGFDPDCHYYNNGITFTVTNSVPEPATMLLLGSGLIGLAGYARRRFKK